MSRHSPVRRSFAAGLLTLALGLVPGAALAGAPSPDDPVATVDSLFDSLLAKDFAGIPAYVCAEKREVVSQRLNLATALGALGEGIDAQALIDAMQLSMPDRSVTLVSNDGATAHVAVVGTLRIALDDAAAREFLRQVLEASGQEVTDEMLDQYLPLMKGQLETGQDLGDPDVEVTLQDGAWLVCDDFAGVSTAPTAPPEPSLAPGQTLPPMDAAARERLLAAIPEPIRASCEPDSYWQIPDLGPEPGEIASVDCDPDGSGGDWVSYSLWDSTDAMDAFYDTQHLGMTNMGALDGPGCGQGPGEGTWEHGRRFCFQPFGDDANMRWTHDELAISGSAIRDDGDWAALEAFFASAGPVAP